VYLPFVIEVVITGTTYPLPQGTLCVIDFKKDSSGITVPDGEFRVVGIPFEGSKNDSL